MKTSYPFGFDNFSFCLVFWSFEWLFETNLKNYSDFNTGIEMTYLTLFINYIR